MKNKKGDDYESSEPLVNLSPFIVSQFAQNYHEAKTRLVFYEKFQWYGCRICQ